MSELQIKVGDKLKCLDRIECVFDDGTEATGPGFDEIVTISRIGCIVDQYGEFHSIFWLEEYPGEREIDLENAFYAIDFEVVS